MIANIPYIVAMTTRNRLLLAGIGLAAGLLFEGAALPDMPGPAHCVLRSVRPSYKGTCGRIFDETPTLTLAPATAVKSGAWQPDRSPQSVWSGELSDDDNPHWPLELELYGGGRGILRTEYGWQPVTQFDATQD